MADVLIVGSGQGIGLGLYKYYQNLGHRVITTSRNVYPHTLSKIDHVNIDLRRVEKSIPVVFELFQDLKVKLELAFFVGAKNYDEVKFIGRKNKSQKNISSVFGDGLKYKNLDEYMKINAFAPIYLYEFLLTNSFFKPNSKTIFFSSRAGSSELRGKLPHMLPGGNIFYRISKAALNNGVSQIAFDLKFNKGGHTVYTLHPGYVKTVSGGTSANLTIQESVRKIYETVEKLDKKNSGKFMSCENLAIPF